MSGRKKKIILDVDTGAGDAAAVILATLSDQIELLGLTTVWGNGSLPVTTKQTLMIVELLKSRAPVYAGCPGPIARGLYRQAHAELTREDTGENGVFRLPEPKTAPREKHAVRYIIDTCRDTGEKITIVAVGPLTNVGMALRIAPDIARQIGEVVVLGGGIARSGSVPCAGGNLLRDPEAAEILAKSGVPVTFISLDAASRAALPKEYVEKCRALGNPVGGFFAEILSQRALGRNALWPSRRPDIVSVHDAVCVAYLIDPSVLTDLRRAHVSVCLDHGNGAGVLVDTGHCRQPENAQIAYDASCEVFGRIVMDTLKKHSCGI